MTTILASSRPIRTAPWSGVLALALLAGCGGSPDGAAAGSSGTGSGSADAAWPVTVQNCGRDVTIDSRPERVVGIEGAAETVLALGAGDQLAGWFGAPADELPADLAAQASSSQHLGGSFPTPQLEEVLAPEPDLVVLYGYAEDAGLTQETFDDLGVPVLLLSEACPDDADHTVEGYFTDVQTFATAVGRPEAGESLVADWRAQIEAATATPAPAGQTVLVNGNPDPQAPFASGGSSLADDQIRIAGGTNVFGDSDEAFLEPSWEEVATRDPQVIVDGSGGMAESTAALRAYLSADPALSQLSAVRTDSFLTLGYYDNVPGPRVVDGVVALAGFLRR